MLLNVRNDFRNWKGCGDADPCLPVSFHSVVQVIEFRMTSTCVIQGSRKQREEKVTATGVERIWVYLKELKGCWPESWQWQASRQRREHAPLGRSFLFLDEQNYFPLKWEKNIVYWTVYLGILSWICFLTLKETKLAVSWKGWWHAAFLWMVVGGHCCLPARLGNFSSNWQPGLTHVKNRINEADVLLTSAHLNLLRAEGRCCLPQII